MRISKTLMYGNLMVLEFALLVKARVALVTLDIRIVSLNLRYRIFRFVSFLVPAQV